MISSNKTLNLLFNTKYWKEYKDYRKIKSILTEFFKGEDIDLQKSFIKNFDYPEIMTNPPVRFEKSSGDIYYTLNFKSKELFENEGTKEQALSNSLAALDKFLPLGITQFVEPQTPIHIPDTFTLLCSLRVQTETTPRKTVLNALGTVLKPLTILIIFSVMLKYLLT